LLSQISGEIDDPAELSEYDLQLGHRRLYSVETLREDLDNAGFRVNWMEGLFLKPLMTAQLVSLNLREEIIRALCELGIEYPELSLGLLAEAVAD
jgi:hypothetical protein